MGGEWFDGVVSVVEPDVVAPGKAGVENAEVGEPESDMLSISYSSSRIAVTVKSVPDPDSGG